MKQIYDFIKKTKSFIHGMLDVFKDRGEKQLSICSLKYVSQVSYGDVPFSIKALVDTFVEDFTPLAETKGLIFAGISNGDDVTILGNHKLIKEIVNRLLTNAIECTLMGYVVLNIEYVNGKLVIYIADSRSDMKMKFGNTEWPEWVARDLSDTFGLINLLNGSIQVISDDGKGYKFIVHLPMSVHKG